jgi:hypothetical protein
MISKNTYAGDDENAAFEFRPNLVSRKPGYRSGSQKPATPGNHQARRGEKKNIPQEPIADRIAKSKGG